MKISDVVSLLKRDMLEIHSPNIYFNPSTVCTKWILLDGAIYGDHEFEGNFILETKKIINWAINQSDRTWINQEYVEQAKKYFPTWLSSAAHDDESLTLLDKYQLEFLRPHIPAFVNMRCFRVYCPRCNASYDDLINNTQKSKRMGKVVKWTEEYQCRRGHILYSEDQEIRFF